MQKCLRNFRYSLESRCSSSGFLSIRPTGEIRSWVDSPSTLDAGTIAILALLSLRRLRVYYILYTVSSSPAKIRAYSAKVLERVLGLQLCRMVTSYFQRHTPTSQIENSKYDCPRLHRIWVPNTTEPRAKNKYWI